MIAKKNTLKIKEIKNSSLQVSLQSCQLSALTSLQVQAVSFAGSFAKISTLMMHGSNYRLRIQSKLSAFANVKPLFFKHLKFSRLHNRLQSCQLSPLTCLQVQAVSFAVYKEKAIENQSIVKFLFVCLFAKSFCRMQKNG